MDSQQQRLHDEQQHWPEEMLLQVFRSAVSAPDCSARDLLKLSHTCRLFRRELLQPETWSFITGGYDLPWLLGKGFKIGALARDNLTKLVLSGEPNGSESSLESGSESDPIFFKDKRGLVIEVLDLVLDALKSLQARSCILFTCLLTSIREGL